MRRKPKCLSLPIWTGGDRGPDPKSSDRKQDILTRCLKDLLPKKAPVYSANLVCTLVAIFSASEECREGNQNREKTKWDGTGREGEFFPGS